MINLFNLPRTGGEEDAADQAAVFLFTLIPLKALYPADYWNYVGQQTTKPVFWDEHSLGQQRFYNILCWVYGSNPKQHSALVPRHLPKQRADRCPGEYKDVQSSWNQLLRPHMSSGGGTTTQPHQPAGGQIVTIGRYVIHLPQGSVAQPKQNGFTEVQQRHKGHMITAEIRPLTNVAPVPSHEQLRTVMNSVNPDMKPIGEPVAINKPAQLRGFAAGQFYQQVYPQSSTGMVSGLFIVHVAPGGQGIAIDVFSPAASNNQNLDAVNEYAGILMNNLRTQ
jgi:hypothetical protein